MCLLGCHLLLCQQSVSMHCFDVTSLWATLLSTVCVWLLHHSSSCWCWLWFVYAVAKTHDRIFRMGMDTISLLNGVIMTYAFDYRFWIFKWLFVIGLVIAFFFIPEGSNFVFSRGMYVIWCFYVCDCGMLPPIYSVCCIWTYRIYHLHCGSDCNTSGLCS